MFALFFPYMQNTELKRVQFKMNGKDIHTIIEKLSEWTTLKIYIQGFINLDRMKLVIYSTMKKFFFSNLETRGRISEI